jgi:hypothetical protein
MTSNDYYGTHVAVWYDQTPDGNAWIVSIEDADGSETLHVFPRSKKRATLAGIREGKLRNLAVYYSWENGEKQCFDCAAKTGHIPECKFRGRPNKDGVI